MLTVRGAAATALLALCVAAPTAVAHQGNPNYRSQVRSITPAVDGLEAQVLGYDDRSRIIDDAHRGLSVAGERWVRIGRTADQIDAIIARERAAHAGRRVRV